MEVGDLIVKFKGYGSELDPPMMGIVITIGESLSNIPRVVVWSADGIIDSWVESFCRTLDEQ